MAFKDRSSASGGGFVGWIIHTILRSLQFVFALTVAGLYGTDLNNARKHGVGGDSKWVGPTRLGAKVGTEAVMSGICRSCRRIVCSDLHNLHGPSTEVILSFAWDIVLL
jgi:hypothetical protein